MEFVFGGDRMKQPVNQSKALFKGAFVLTIAALITKILSAFYRIPYQNIVGDVGFYIYQQVYPFYGLAVVLSTTGFPVVISKLYAEQQEQGNQEKNCFLLLMSYIYLQLFGFLFFLILYFGAGEIALWMKDSHLSVLLKVVSIVFLTFPLVSLLRGYYQGKGDMVPTALSQVGEQTTRVLTIIFLAFLFTRKGYPPYIVGGGAMFGSITGSLLSAFILFTFIWIRKEWIQVRPSKGILSQYSQDAKRIFKAMTFQGLTICISGMLLIFIQMADALNLYSLLVSSGVREDMAKNLKGIFDRGQPLIQLGTVAATSMSLSLVPLISSGRLREKPEFLLHKIKSAIKISLVIAMGASAGLCTIIRPTNTMLFENGCGSSVLGVLSFVILFSSVISTITAIMQGLGKLVFPAIAIAAAFPIKYFLNVLLVPWFGTMGAALSTIVTLAIVCLLLVVRLKKILKVPLFSLRLFSTLLIGTLAMVIFLKGYLDITNLLIGSLTMGRLGAAFQSLSSAILGGLLFLFIILRGKIFLADELAFFPFGSKLLLLTRKDRG
jgi:O-antigen/teichoic acid export membrane protein